MIMPPARVIDYKTSVPDMRNLLSSYMIRTELLLLRVAQEAPKTVQAVAGVLGSIPEVEGRSLLLKTP